MDRIQQHIRKGARAAIIAGEILPVLQYGFVHEIMEHQRQYKGTESRNEDAAAPLTLWDQKAPAVTELTEYIKEITTEGGENFIPPEKRIAVSDLDGTLFCETDPTYFDYCVLLYRVCKDPDYRDKASAFERSVAARIQDVIENGTASTGLDVECGKAISSAFAGFSIEEFEAYIRTVRDQPANGYDGMKIGEAFYKPMLQVIDYLKQNGFVIYICSGTDRMVVRSIVDGEVPVMPAQVLGTDEVLVARKQGHEDGIDYAFDDKDELVLGGRMLVKNLKMNKVSVIAREIGQQPVLCFGNSAGDSSMANYVTNGNPYKTGVYMVCCDDLVRENGNMEKAEKMRTMCVENGWTPISMKNDWLTIYGDGVKKKA